MKKCGHLSAASGRCFSKAATSLIVLVAFPAIASTMDLDQCEVRAHEYLFDGVLDLPQDSPYRDPNSLYNVSHPFMSDNWTDTNGFLWPWQNKIDGFNYEQNRVFLVTLEGCLNLCGRGFQSYGLSEIANILATWILPVLSLIVQLPFQSNDAKGNLWAICRWLGCPPAALAATLWSIWIIKKAEQRSTEYYSASGLPGDGTMSSRDAFYVLSVLNQYQFDVNNRLLHKSLFYGLFEPEIQAELAVLAHQLRTTRRKNVIPIMLSLIWFLVALVITIFQAFGDLGQNITAHSLALNLLVSWLPGLTAMSIVDRNPMADKKDKAMLEKWLHNAQYHRQLRAVRSAEKILEELLSQVDSPSRTAAGNKISVKDQPLAIRWKDAISEVRREVETTRKALILVRDHIRGPAPPTQPPGPPFPRRQSNLANLKRTVTVMIGRMDTNDLELGREKLQDAIGSAIASLLAHIQELQSLETWPSATPAGPDEELIERYKATLRDTTTKYFPARIIRTIRKSPGVTRLTLLKAISKTSGMKDPISVPATANIAGQTINNYQSPSLDISSPSCPDENSQPIKAANLRARNLSCSAESADTVMTFPYCPQIRPADPEIQYVLALFAAQVETLPSLGYWRGGPRRFELGEFRGQGRYPWHYGCAAAVFKRLELESDPKIQLKSRKASFWKNEAYHDVAAQDTPLPRSEQGDDIFMAILKQRKAYFGYYAFLWAVSVLTFVVADSLAFMVSYTTPTVGMGCRSFMCLMYGIFVLSGVLLEGIGAPLNHHKRRKYRRYILFVSRAFEILAVMALTVTMISQMFGFFQNCYCKASVMGIGAGGYLSFESAAWVRGHYAVEIWWILAGGGGVLFVTFQILWAVYLWLKCKGLWRASEDPTVNLTLDWEDESMELARQQHRWDMNWLQ